MPTYDYECLDCGEHFEAFQKMSDAPLKQCSCCGGKVRRLISAGSGLIFKGSGFYANDYKKKGASGETKKDIAAKPCCPGCKDAPCAQNENKKK